MSSRVHCYNKLCDYNSFDEELGYGECLKDTVIIAGSGNECQSFTPDASQPVNVTNGEDRCLCGVAPRNKYCPIHGDNVK